MKFNLTEIGGRETGAAAIRPVGTTTLEDALAYANVGRKILGDFKQRLQQGGLKDGRFEQTLQDGTIITVITNMIGLAPIDQIYVDTGQRKRKQSFSRCIGYIVQGFTDSPYYSVLFDLTTPSGARLPYSNDFASYGSTLPADMSPPGVDVSAPFVDNGAKYLNYYKSGDLTDYQEVLLNFNYYYSVFDNRGPNVYSVAPVGDGLSSPLFVGDGALTYVWDTSLVINVNPENSYNSITYDIPAYEYSDTNPDTEWNMLGISFEDWADHMSNYINENFWGPLIIPRINDIASEAYDIKVASQDTTVGYDYRWLFADSAGGTFQRRRDSKGFVTNMGFEMVRNDADFVAIGGSGIVFHELGQSYGEGALFMMPYSAERRNLKLAQSVREYQEAISDFNVTETITGSVNAAVGTLAPGVPASTFHEWSYADDEAGPNIVETDYNTWTPASTFAIPIKVEAGIHKIKVKRQSTAAQIKKLKIFLLVDGDNGGALIERTIQQADIVLGSTETEWSKEIHIQIGEFSGNQIDSLVSLKTI
jgi:hypothetical protein